MKTRIAAMAFVWLLAIPRGATRIPFSGSLGATSGAGAMVGWETLGLGLNPASGETRRWEFSMATYAPFGLDDLRISEVGAARFGSRWGTAVDYRGWGELDGFGTAIGMRQSLAFAAGFRLGVSTEWRNGDEHSGIREMGTGVLWNRLPYFRVGAAVTGAPNSGFRPRHADLGVDAGFTFRSGAAFRLCAETHFEPESDLLWRFGAKLRLHSMLSLQAGYSPTPGTFGLGLQFGLGGWEGFHALRIHPVLGSTSIQSLRWKRPWGV